MERIRSPEPNRGGPCNNLCGFCYENRTCRSNHKGHRWYKKPPNPYTLTPWEILNVKRPELQPGMVGAEKPLVGAFLSDYPTVWSYLTESKWDDGKPRERATILIVCDGGVAKLWLGDNANKRTCWTTGESLEQAFTLLEDSLAHNSASWRPMEDKRQQRGRRG